MKKVILGLTILVLLGYGCTNRSDKQNNTLFEEEEKIGNIELPKDFTADVFADNIGTIGHLAINKNGDIYVALNNLENDKAIVALRDSDNNGKADLIRYFGNEKGGGIAIYNGYIYFASDNYILRYQLIPNELLPDTIPEIVVKGLSQQGIHQTKAITIDLLGNLFINIGGISNACGGSDTDGKKGLDPCPELDYNGGIWRFSANKLNQTLKEHGERYATGIRNASALKWNFLSNKLYAVQNGRDQLYELYPEIYDEENAANLPAEEFFLIEKGDDFGWPYCYFDPFQIKKVLSPEYGGNGELSGRCEMVKGPIMVFPAHMGPNCLVFYQKDLFPEKYKNGAFISFNGVDNTSTNAREGSIIAFVPFNGIFPEGQWETFAKQFSENMENESERNENIHFNGIAVNPQGAMFLSDSNNGAIWKITFNRNRK